VPDMITERSQPASARVLYPPSNIAAALGGVRAETFNLYAKTKRLLRQMCGSDFHEYRQLLEDQRYKACEGPVGPGNWLAS
jgi:hypothetical protein